jgi:hypothetical protein
LHKTIIILKPFIKRKVFKTIIELREEFEKKRESNENKNSVTELDDINILLLNSVLKNKHLILNLGKPLDDLWLKVSQELKNSKRVQKNLKPKVFKQLFQDLISELETSLNFYDNYEEIKENFQLFDKLTEIPLKRFLTEDSFRKLIRLTFDSSYDSNDSSNDRLIYDYYLPKNFNKKFLRFSPGDINFCKNLLLLVYKYFNTNYAKQLSSDEKWFEITNKSNKKYFKSMEIKDFFDRLLFVYIQVFIENIFFSF